MPQSTTNAVPRPRRAQARHAWDYVGILVRRRQSLLAIFLMVAALGTLRTLIIQPVYEGTVQILIERENPNVLTFKEVAEIDTGRDDYYQTQYKLLQSRALAGQVIRSMRLLEVPEFRGAHSEAEVAEALAAPPGKSRLFEDAVDRLLSRIEVKAVRNSRLVAVTFSSYRPELAADIANRLSQLYIQQTMQFRYETSADAAQWLGDQVEQQRQRVKATETALDEVRKRLHLANVEERRTLLDQQLKELGTALTALNTQRLRKEALYRQMVQAKRPEELPAVRSSPLIQSLNAELASLGRREAQLLDLYMSEHPEVLRVRSQIADTHDRIALEAQTVIRASESDYRETAAQEASLAAAVEGVKHEMQDLARRASEYDALKRDLTASHELLNTLLARQKQTDVAQDLRASNIRIVDAAVVPSSPVRPRRVRDIALSVLLGMFLAVGAAFLFEYLDDTVKTPEDVRRHLDVPVLGVIPEATTESQATVTDGGAMGARSAPAVPDEAYRVVRTALHYSFPEPGSRMVVVTSTMPSEGKTLTSMNLAASLGSVEGGRILLIDGDMHQPRLHLMLDVPRAPGFSDVLVGRAQTAAVIQKTPHAAVSLMTAGTSVPSPADLLTNVTAREVLAGLRRLYDWIVIDTPPLGAVIDGLVVAPWADGVVVVTGAEMVPYRAVQHTLDRIDDTGARVLGVVLNRVHLEKHGRYYRGPYGRYYGHYGYEPRKDQDRAHAGAAASGSVVPMPTRSRRSERG